MDDKEKNQLHDFILSQHEEASFIVINFKQAVREFLEKIRNKVYEQLQVNLKDRYSINLGWDVDKKFSQIWIRLKGKEENKIFFGIQSFAIEKDDFVDDLFVGIFVFDGKYEPEYDQLGKKNSPYWIGVQQITEYKGCKVNLSDSGTIQKLHKDTEFADGFVDHIVNESIQYFNEHHDSVAALLKDKSV